MVSISQWVLARNEHDSPFPPNNRQEEQWVGGWVWGGAGASTPPPPPPPDNRGKGRRSAPFFGGSSLTHDGLDDDHTGVDEEVDGHCVWVCWVCVGWRCVCV